MILITSSERDRQGGKAGNESCVNPRPTNSILNNLKPRNICSHTKHSDLHASVKRYFIVNAINGYHVFTAD